MQKTNDDDGKLLSEFVSCFGYWDGLVVGCDVGLVSSELATGQEDEYGSTLWQPLRVDAPPAALEALYAVLSARLPLLYERLVLSYRWAAVDLGRYELLANPPGPDLTRLLQTVSWDPGLWKVLLPAGYFQFGHTCYDPVCFDLRRGCSDQDCRIVRIDHEWILCDELVYEVDELASTFRDLVQQTIRDARGSAEGRTATAD